MAINENKPGEPKTLAEWTDSIYEDNRLTNDEVTQFDRQSDAAIDELIKKHENIHAKKTSEEKNVRPERARGLKHFKSSIQLTSDLLQEALLSSKRSLAPEQFKELQPQIKEAVMFQILYLKVCLDRFD